MFVTRKPKRGVRARSQRSRRDHHRAEVVARAATEAKRWAPWIAIGSAGAALVGVVSFRRWAHRTSGDDALADAIRARLRPVRKHLHVPQIEVETVNGFAVLRGSVKTRAQANEIERTVAAVAGVKGVESHLLVGPPPDGARERRRFRGVKIGRIGVGARDRERAPAVASTDQPRA